MPESKHLAVAVFESEAAAIVAARWLKRWGGMSKDVDDIKFRAMAVLTVDEGGGIRIRRVGRSAAAAGAEVGLIIGGLAGLLTGGVALLGGLAAGALAGGAGGSLIRKGLGMYEGDLEELVDQLCSGRAALAIVVDESHLTAVREHLIDLGGSTRIYECSLEELKKGSDGRS